MKLQTQSCIRHQCKLVKILTTAATTATLAIGIVATTANAGDRQKFTDYARVVHVEPAYRYVTVKIPQRVCTPRNNHRSGSHTYNSHTYNSHTRLNSPNHGNQHNQRRNQRTDSTGAVFIGGVIGGAIGHEVSRSMNGRGSAGATIAGAIIGSSLANSVSRNNHHRGNRGNNHSYATANHDSRLTSQRPQHRQRRDHNRQRAHRNQHQNNRHHNQQQRCTTTTETRRERHNDGYDVTYIYKGRSFSTRTSHHPGNRIAVQVAVSTH